MPEPTPNEDLAVRYLLGELEGPDKSRFEAELAASPSLRAQLQELEAACDALALSAPARRPPQRVWKAITRAIGPSETRTPLPRNRTFPGAWFPAREWFWRLTWAAAACCITLWVVRTPSDTPSSPGDFAGADPGPAPSSAHPNPLAPRQPGPSSQSADGPARAPARPDSQLAGTRLSEQEWIELRRRLQELGVLNQSLSQQLALPPGAARFQVFRLSPTNTGGIAATQSSANLMAHSEHDASTAEATALQNLLTQALARELAANTIKSPPASASSSADTLAQGPGQGTTTGSSSSSGTAPSSSSTPSAGDTTSPADATSTTVASRTPDKTTPSVTPPSENLSTATPEAQTDTSPKDGSSFTVVTLDTEPPPSNLDAGYAPPTTLVNRNATSTPSGGQNTDLSSSAGASAVGVYSAETGVGSIAFVAPSELPAGYAYQFWVVNSQAAAAYSLGTTTYSGGKMVVNFSLDPSLVFSPGFLVTLEPEGGSPMPTGPVVVAPPATSTPTPAPTP